MTTIRPATAANAADLDAIQAAAVREFGPRAYDEAVVRHWAGHDVDWDARSERTVVVAERDGSVVGFGELDPDAGEVVSVYVHPNAARSGVGSAILRELEQRARHRGVDTMGVLSSLNAVEFYERHGYERTDRVTYEFEDGVEMAAVWLEKSL